MRPSTSHALEHKNKRINTVPSTFQIAGIKSYFEDPYTECQLPPPEKKPLHKVHLKFKGKKNNTLYNPPHSAACFLCY